MLEKNAIFEEIILVIFQVKIGKIFFKEKIFRCKKISDVGLENVSESLKGLGSLESVTLEFFGYLGVFEICY